MGQVGEALLHEGRQRSWRLMSSMTCLLLVLVVAGDIPLWSTQTGTRQSERMRSEHATLPLFHQQWARAPTVAAPAVAALASSAAAIAAAAVRPLP
eukprot:40079-Chlamydomonas_euryale.AAC.1